MRIALLQPTYWPEVRRGSERLAHDLGVTLVARGHEVTLLTSHRGWPGTIQEEGMKVRRGWRPPERGPLGWYEHHVANIPNALAGILRGGFDLAHAFYPPDAWAAVCARRLGGPPVVYSVHGILNRAYLVKRRYRLELTEAAIRRADAISVLSDAAAAPLRSIFGREPSILPGGVIAQEFHARAVRDPAPTFVSAASLGDPRKRADLLFDAFAIVRTARPQVRLRVIRTPDPVMSGAPVALPEGADWIEVGGTGELARAYASAWASVLPSVDEAFGLVLLESLAAGTPVVAARSGACPELVPDRRVGRLFEPDDADALAAAMLEALELGSDESTAQRCVAAARDHDWARVVERYEVLYDEVAGGN